LLWILFSHFIINTNINKWPRIKNYYQRNKISCRRFTPIILGPAVIYNAFMNKENNWHYLVLAIGILVGAYNVFMYAGLKFIMKSLFNDWWKISSFTFKTFDKVIWVGKELTIANLKIVYLRIAISRAVIFEQYLWTASLSIAIYLWLI
jgi:hypothetical protein